MEIDKNKIIKINDCKGTCKTIIGCTCKVIEDEKLIIEPSNNRELKQEQVQKKGCPCSKMNKSCCYGSNKLEVFNWLQDYSDMNSNLVEVQFKNTRKEYFKNSNNLDVIKGDIVVVEANPGYDVGMVTLTGKLVELQIKKVNYKSEIRRIYRAAKPADLEKYEESKAKEHSTMLKAREIAEELNLEMKISDVEFQGDGNKAIFYYIADGRVDFRQLIKHYASLFKIKIEMKQIGARQEAGRVGGIGPCGRQLCCSSSMSNFVSVSTSAARVQDIPLNPQKMAGQCGKLKCCMNFEVDLYVEAQRKLPPSEIELRTKDATYYFFKSDLLKSLITYSSDRSIPANLTTISAKRAFDIIYMNKKGEKPDFLDNIETKNTESSAKTFDLLETESITRFDSTDPKKKKNNKRKKKIYKNQEGEKPILTKDNEDQSSKSISKNKNFKKRKIEKKIDKDNSNRKNETNN